MSRKLERQTALPIEQEQLDLIQKQMQELGESLSGPGNNSFSEDKSLFLTLDCLREDRPRTISWKAGMIFKVPRLR